MLSQYVGKVVLYGGGSVSIGYALFRYLGSKWLESKFAERLANLKFEQDQAIRHVQSTIDREIHRAKALYDSEFTALSECWRLLREAYDQSVGTIASYTANVERLNNQELERLLTKLGMEEWQRNEMRALTGKERQHAVHRWSEWERYKEVEGTRRKFRNHLDANSIFFADGFTEMFRDLDAMIIASNIEYEGRIEYHGTGGISAHLFEATHKLRTDGGAKMKDLEGMVRKRLWSVAADSETKR